MKKFLTLILSLGLVNVLLFGFFWPSLAAFAQTSNLRTDQKISAPTELQQKRTIEAARQIQTDHKNTNAKGFQFPKIPWETIAVVVSILSGAAAIMGFSLSGHKKKRAISKYMEEIDQTYMGYKSKSKRCEAELYRLRDLLEDRLKKGKIDESLYELLCKRIDKYLKDIQEN